MSLYRTDSCLYKRKIVIFQGVFPEEGVRLLQGVRRVVFHYYVFKDKCVPFVYLLTRPGDAGAPILRLTQKKRNKKIAIFLQYMSEREKRHFYRSLVGTGQRGIVALKRRTEQSGAPLLEPRGEATSGENKQRSGERALLKLIN